MPYGLAAWVHLGERYDVACPVMRSLVELNSAALGIDFWKSARTLEDLGIAGMSKDALLSFLDSGERHSLRGN